MTEKGDNCMVTELLGAPSTSECSGDLYCDPITQKCATRMSISYHTTPAYNTKLMHSLCYCILLILLLLQRVVPWRSND